jgi:hypothetical protein
LEIFPDPFIIYGTITNVEMFGIYESFGTTWGDCNPARIHLKNPQARNMLIFNELWVRGKFVDI